MNILELIDEMYEIEPQQRLMLKALIHGGKPGREYFEYWRSSVDFESMDYSTLRLVPALLYKYGDMLDDSPHLGRMQGICRYFIFRNSLIFAEGRRIVARLIAEGIDVLLFKGIAISLKYYSNRNLRPMADIDVLVHPGNVN